MHQSDGPQMRGVKLLIEALAPTDRPRLAAWLAETYDSRGNRRSPINEWRGAAGPEEAPGTTP